MSLKLSIDVALRPPKQSPSARPSKGQPVGEGVVHVFDEEGHPKATRTFEWSAVIEGSTKRRYYTVLQLGGITTPLDAVRGGNSSGAPDSSEGVRGIKGSRIRSDSDSQNHCTTC